GAKRSAAISPQLLTRTRLPPLYANVLRASQPKLPGTALRRYQCDRYPPLPWRGWDSRHRPGPNVRLARSAAEYRAKRRRLQSRKGQRRLSWRTWIRGSRSPPERRAQHPVDMELVVLGGLGFASQSYAVPRRPDLRERRCKGCSQAAAGARPTRTDEHRHRR